MTLRPTLRHMYLCTILICAALSISGARGDGKDASGLKIGVVNPGRLFNEYKFTVESDKQLKLKQNDLETELVCWSQHKLLGEPDQHILADITVKESHQTPLTPAESKDKTRIEEAYKTLFSEFLGIQQNQQPTPAETGRLQALTRLETDTDKRIKDRQASVQDALAKEVTDGRAKIAQAIKDSIAAEAKAKSFNLVFSSDALLYCDNDLTDDVLKKMNK